MYENTHELKPNLPTHTFQKDAVLHSNNIIRPIDLVNNKNKNKNKKQNFFKILSEYYKDAKQLGYSWIDLVRKDTRSNVITTVERERSIKDKIKEIPSEDTKNEDDIMKSYPKINMTIKDSRMHEIFLSDIRGRQHMSFIELFNARMIALNRPTSTVSMTIDVSIMNSDNDVINKSYGPFQTQMPINLYDGDKYKFALYTLIVSHINLLSGESIIKLGFKYMRLRKRNIIHHKMGRLRLENYLLGGQKKLKSHGKDLCVIDYVWDAIQNKRGFRRHTFDRLKNEIYNFVVDKPMVSTYELI